MVDFFVFGLCLIGYLNNKVVGIEMNIGLFGYGLFVLVGMVLVVKMDGKSYYIYIFMGDGEFVEGFVWEGVMVVVNYKLDNLIVIIDWNFL